MLLIVYLLLVSGPLACLPSASAIAQGGHQFFQFESARAGPGSKLFDQLLQSAGMLDCITIDGLLSNKRARALLGVEDAADFHFAIGPHDGVGVDLEVDGNLTDGGQLIAGNKRPAAMAAWTWSMSWR